MSMKVLTTMATRLCVCVCSSVAFAHLDPVIFHHSAVAEGQTCCLWTIVTAAVSSRSLSHVSLFQTGSACPLGVFCLYIFSILLLSSLRLQRLSRTCCKSQPPPHCWWSFCSVMVVVHQSYLTKCLKSPQTQTSSKGPVVLVVFLCRPLIDRLVKAHSNSCCMQSLSRLCCWIFYLLQMVINVFQASLTSLFFARWVNLWGLPTPDRFTHVKYSLRLLIMES